MNICNTPILQIVGYPNNAGYYDINTTEKIDEVIAYLQQQKNEAIACLYGNIWDFEVVEFSIGCPTLGVSEWSATITAVTPIPVGVNVPISITINGLPITIVVAAVTLSPNTGSAAVGIDGVSIDTTTTINSGVSLHISGSTTDIVANGDTAVITIIDNNSSNNQFTNNVQC